MVDFNLHFTFEIRKHRRILTTFTQAYYKQHILPVHNLLCCMLIIIPSSGLSCCGTLTFPVRCWCPTAASVMKCPDTSAAVTAACRLSVCLLVVPRCRQARAHKCSSQDYSAAPHLSSAALISPRSDCRGAVRGGHG